MIHNRRLATMLLFAAFVARAEHVRLIAPESISAVLQDDLRVRIVTRDKKVLKGKATRVTAGGVTVQTDNQETHISIRDIDRFTVTRMRGNKRTRLPLILCSTIGTTSFIAAGATEERKSTYLPMAAALTVGVGLGGYYAGRALDQEKIAYTVNPATKP